MDKLLHKRLRDPEAIEEGVIKTDSGITVTCLIESEMIALADEIDKYYIPRPRYKNGEPITDYTTDVEWNNQKNAMFCVNGFAVFGDTGTLIPIALLQISPSNMKLLDIAKVDCDGCVKHPEQKALDANGVETNVGDTVWIIKSGAKGKVEEINKGRAYIKYDDGWLSGIHVSNLTHREPDNLKKLRDEIQKDADELKHTPYQGTRNKLNGYADRLTAIMERDA